MALSPFSLSGCIRLVRRHCFTNTTNPLAGITTSLIDDGTALRSQLLVVSQSALAPPVHVIVVLMLVLVASPAVPVSGAVPQRPGACPMVLTPENQRSRDRLMIMRCTSLVPS